MRSRNAEHPSKVQKKRRHSTTQTPAKNKCLKDYNSWPNYCEKFSQLTRKTLTPYIIIYCISIWIWMLHTLQSKSKTLSNFLWVICVNKEANFTQIWHFSYYLFIMKLINCIKLINCMKIRKIKIGNFYHDIKSDSNKSRRPWKRNQNFFLLCT